MNHTYTDLALSVGFLECSRVAPLGQGSQNLSTVLPRVGVCAVLVWSEGFQEYFRAASLEQRPQTLIGRFAAGDAFAVLILSGKSLESTQVASLELGPMTPRRIRLHKTILQRYDD